jgi:hypothetical protein
LGDLAESCLGVGEIPLHNVFLHSASYLCPQRQHIVVIAASKVEM